MALVAIGGFAGGTMRFFLSGLIANRFGETFPWGTLVVNVSGCVLIGLLAGMVRSVPGAGGEPWLSSLLITGLCGGYTTVSSFSLQTLNLAVDGESRLAVLNAVGSAFLCLAAVAAGWWAAMAMAA